MKILDNNNDHVSLFYVLLLQCGKYSFLPELYDMLGEEKTLQVLEVFAGKTIRFPLMSELTRIARDIAIYCRIAKVPENSSTPVVNDLATEYNMEAMTVRKVYSEMSKTVQALGIKFLFKH